MSAFFLQAKPTAVSASLISVGPNAPVKMACVALGCNHDACADVPLAVMRSNQVPVPKRITPSPELQMRCLAAGCTHPGCVTVRHSVLFAPAKPEVAAHANMGAGGVIELAGAVQMACVAFSCSHASCSGTRRPSSQAQADMVRPAASSPYPAGAAHSDSTAGARLVRRNAITARSPRLGLGPESSRTRHTSSLTDETEGSLSS